MSGDRLACISLPYCATLNQLHSLQGGGRRFHTMIVCDDQISTRTLSQRAFQLRDIKHAASPHTAQRYCAKRPKRVICKPSADPFTKSGLGTKASRQNKNGAVASAVLGTRDRAHSDWRWRERPARARLGVRDPLMRLRRSRVKSIEMFWLTAKAPRPQSTARRAGDAADIRP